MTEIIKTEAVVLSKMNYRDSSKIAHLFTKDYGRLSGIIKGARKSTSKIGVQVDLFNHINVVLYRKESREIQLITQADLINYYPNIKNNLEHLKYASAILELVNRLTLEGENNSRLFNGIIKILSLIEKNDFLPGIALIKFMLFLLKELGYEAKFDKCGNCGRQLSNSEKSYFHFDKNVICINCAENIQGLSSISPELFIFLNCLNQKHGELPVSQKDIDNAIFFIERFIKYHIPEFKGINSIHLY